MFLRAPPGVRFLRGPNARFHNYTRQAALFREARKFFLALPQRKLTPDHLGFGFRPASECRAFARAPERGSSGVGPRKKILPKRRIIGPKHLNTMFCRWGTRGCIRFDRSVSTCACSGPKCACLPIWRKTVSPNPLSSDKYSAMLELPLEQAGLVSKEKFVRV